jgi:hypothetical protein
MRTILFASLLTLCACAGGTQEAALMPTSMLCQTIIDLGPQYLRINEYLVELHRRGGDCEVGETTTIRVR